MNYTPLLHDEQEVLLRMIEDQAAYVEIEGWGYHSNPKITAGDKRVQVRFPMEFSKPVGISVPVHSFKLILRLRDGRKVFEDTKSVAYNNNALWVQAGLCIDLIWDIALDKISDEFQRIFLPGTKGKKVMSIKNGQVVRESNGKA